MCCLKAPVGSLLGFGEGKGERIGAQCESSFCVETQEGCKTSRIRRHGCAVDAGCSLSLRPGTREEHRAGYMALPGP